MKKNKNGILLTILLMGLLAGCGSKASDAAVDTMSGNSAYSAEVAEMPGEAGETADVSASENETPDVGEQNRKLIKTVYLEMETLEFDSLTANISSKVEALGGYLERSEISGAGYQDSGRHRTAYFVARIPVASLNQFVEQVSGMGNVTSRQESVEDITLNYVDVESHVNALKVEQQRLTELIAAAESVEDIITLEARLSEVRYELESYESQLRTYDNQVDYSTVTMDIQEVERETPEQKNTVSSRISTGLSNSFYHLGKGLEDFFVGLIVASPFLLIMAAVIFVILLIIHVILRRTSGSGIFHRRKKKHSTKSLEKEEEKKTDGK